MKKLFSLLLLLLSLNSYAQDTAVLISQAMFKEKIPAIYLTTLNDWYFKQGNDASLAKPNINMAGWEKLRPADLTAKYADTNGRVEGWFRIKIKLDRVFDTQGLGVYYYSCAAADVFVNGKLISSHGNTGQNGRPFAESAFSLTKRFDPTAVDLRAGMEYLIAVHFVDYLTPLPARRLRSADLGPDNMLALTKKQGNSYSMRISMHQTSAP